MNRVFKSCVSEPPDTDRYVSVMFDSYETAGMFIDGKWMCKIGADIKTDNPDTWCEIDWNDIVFSGFWGELTKDRISKLREKGCAK